MSFSAFLSKVSVAALFVVAPTVFAATANPPKYAPEGDVEAGKALAESRGCVGCHGEAGNSDTPSYPKLTGLGEKYLLKQLKDVQSGKRVITLMGGILDGLNEQALRDIAAYYDCPPVNGQCQPMNISGADVTLKVKVNAGIEVDALELGERVYRSGNLETKVPACTGCHSPTGQGNQAAGYPRLGGQHAEYIEAQLKAFRDGERVNDGDSMIMRGVAKNMSDAEIKALANYISGLKP